MSKASITFQEKLIRALKGILTAWEEWLKDRGT